MKKVLLIFAALILIAIVAVAISLGSIASTVVKEAINKYGPQMTDTKVSVQDVSIKPYIGSATIKDLQVGNPEGYKAPDAFSLGRIHVSLSPMSLMSDTIKISAIEIEDPVFSYESNLMSSNLSKIMDNIKSNTKSTEKKAEEQAETSGDGPQKKFVINRILVSGGTVKVAVLNQSAEVKLPEIKLENFSPEGITAAQASNEIMNVVLDKVIYAATELAVNAAGDPLGSAKGITDTALESAGDVGKEISGAVGGLFGGDKKDESK